MGFRPPRDGNAETWSPGPHDSAYRFGGAKVRIEGLTETIFASAKAPTFRSVDLAAPDRLDLARAGLPSPRGRRPAQRDRLRVANPTRFPRSSPGRATVARRFRHPAARRLAAGHQLGACE